MKVYSSELFHLIKSLSKSEKIYFRKYCKAFFPNGATGYMQLFDFLKKLKAYDEKLVKNHFENTEIGKHFSVKKNYLQGVIYKALNSYYSDQTYDIQVRNLLNIADILHYKNLNTQSDNCLEKASRIAVKFQMDTYSLEIEKSRISKAFLSRSLKKISQLQSQSGYNQKHYMDSLEKSFKVKNIMLQIVSDFQQSGKLFKHSLRYSEYENVLKQTLKEIDSPSEQTFCLQVLSLLYQNTGRTIEVINTRKHQLNIFSANRDLKDAFSARYLACLNDISQQYRHLHRYRDCLNAVKICLAEIEHLPFGRTKYFQLNYKLHSYQILLDLYKSAGLYEQAIALVNIIEGMIEENLSDVSAEFRLVLNLQFASIHFMAGNYVNCQRYIHSIFNDTSKVRKDIQISTSILNILTQFERKEYDYLNYLINYYSKKYKSRSPRYNFYPRVLATIGKGLNRIIENRKEGKEFFRELLDLFKEVESDENKNHVLQGFNYIAWVESKLEGKPMFQIIQNENKRLVDILKRETSL